MPPDASTSVEATPPESPSPRAIDNTGRWVLFATISAASMAFIGGSALNVAIPTIQQDLGADAADMLWVVNAYALPLGALLLVGGSLGDHYGRKLVYMIGIVLFGIASLLCGIAPTTELLILARGLQGIGGALMVPGSLAIISAYFDSKTRGQAIGTWAAFTTMTSVLGPLLGGLFADIGLWRAVFLINLPLGAAAIYALVTHVPESKDENAPSQLDIIGAVIVTLSLFGIVYGATEIGRAGADGLTRLDLIVPFVAGLLGVVAFVYVEWVSDHPMIQLSLFCSRTFSGANLLTLFLYGALGIALLFLPLNLVQIQGYSASGAGLATLPFMFLLVVLSRWAGGLVDRFGPRPPLTIGPFIVGIGFLLLVLPGITDGPSTYFTTFFPGLFVFGLGMGITVSPLTTSVMGSVPQDSAGVASGINNTMSRASGVLATAILGGLALVFFADTLMANATVQELPDETQAVIEASAGDLAETQIPDDLDAATQVEVQRAVDEAFVATYNLLMIICAGMSFLSAALAFLFVEKTLQPQEV